MDAAVGRIGGQPERVARIGFDLGAKGLTGIVVKGTLLSLATFGIYRFWYITNLRRYFWSRTTVAGSAGEYTGRGKELFLGFLVALAILIPVYVGLFALGFAYEPLAPFAAPISFVFLFLLGQYAIFRGRRYRASRTLWRGIRLGQDGSAVTYMAMATGWWLLTIVTLGLAFPYMRASLERYRINHTLIGESRMASSATGSSVLLPWLLFYAVALLPMIATGILFLVANDFTIPGDLFVANPDSDSDSLKFNPDYAGTNYETYGLIALSSLGFGLPAALLLIPFYRARETKVFMEAASLGAARLSSTLRARQFYWPYIIYFLSIFGFLVVAGVVAGGLVYLLNTAGAESGFHIFIMLFLVIAYFGALLLFAVLYIRIVTARLWHAVAVTTQIENADALEAVLASSRRVGSGMNEGLADALDVGGAIEIGF